MTQKNVRFKAGLSNGETIFEGKGDYSFVPGGLSAWHRLTAYLEQKSLKITSLALYTDNGQEYKLTSLGRNPKFREFAEAKKPIEYKFKRKIGMDAQPGAIQDRFAVIIAVYENFNLELWVNENNPKNSFVLVR